LLISKRKGPPKPGGAFDFHYAVFSGTVRGVALDRRAGLQD
jgi:hypothetical protein